jgi:outer membrane protein TolC
MKKYITFWLCIAAMRQIEAQEMPLTATLAQEHPQTLTLQGCIVQALEQSFEIKILQNEAQVASNNFTRGNAGYLPNIAGNAGANGHLWHWKEASHDETLLANVGIEWSAFDGYKRRAVYEWLRETKNKGELATAQATERQIAEVIVMYYDLVRRSITADNILKSMILSRYRLKIAQEKFLLGACSRLETLQAEADFNADSSAYVVYLEGTNQLKLRFKQRLRMPYTQDFELADTAIPLRNDLDINDLYQKALTQNISLRIQDKNRTLADWERKQIESERYPYLNLNGNYGYTGALYNQPPHLHRLGFTYGATLGIKLYDGGNRQRRERNAKLQQHSRELEYQQQEQQITADLHTLYSSYTNYLDLLQLETANSRLAAEKADLALEQYQRGQLSSIEMREFQRTLLEAQNRLVTAEYQAKYAEVNLLELCAMTALYVIDGEGIVAEDAVQKP